MMNREYGSRGNMRGGCCMSKGNDRNERAGCNGGGGCHRVPEGARETERANRCGICDLIRGESDRCSDGQIAHLLHRLQALDFTLQELVLYLDMYPDCRRALSKLHMLRQERAAIVQKLEALGVPITATGNESQERWHWIDGPWPWEIDFPGNSKN